MVDLPVWVWVLSVLGVIATGIGLGYLIILLFWQIEKYFSPPPVRAIERKEEPPVFVEPEPVEEPEPEPEPDEEMPPLEEVPDEEWMEPIMPASMNEGDNRFIKFTTVLHARFKHPFTGVNTIVCWDIGLENGDEVRDPTGAVMQFRVIEPSGKFEAVRNVLIDTAGEKTIRVIAGKKYLEEETNLHTEKLKLP